jgi:hypothetical protein
MMKNYKVTNRGKILITVYFIGILGSYFFRPLIFYSLIGLLVVIFGLEIIHYLVKSMKNGLNQGKEVKNGEIVEVKRASENLEAVISKVKVDEGQENQKNQEEISTMDSTEKAFQMDKEDYGNIVNGFESIEEDIQSMEKDLEIIGQKATDLQKTSIENYYGQKKKMITNNLDTSKNKPMDEAPQNYEEVSLLDSFIEKLKEFFSFRSYKKGSLVLHKHFGIGKIIDTEETLKVSFIIDDLEEVLEFEYDKNNKIPELNLFKAPKGEDERQYYYNYKKDVSDALLSIIDKIDLNLPDIKYQWNVFLKLGNSFEKYDFIAISDQVHVFTKEKKKPIKTQLLEELLEDFELEVKIHEISEYTSINSILLKSKIKGIMPLETMTSVNKKIEESNIVDFNERMHYLNKSEGL